MPPNLDIYVISKRRDRETVDRFVSEWVDRAKSEDRGNEELMLLTEPGGPEQWEPARTLSHVIDRGLDLPPRAFAVYLESKDQAVYDVILAFTIDNRVVFGVSLDDANGSDETLDVAKRILGKLIQDFDAEAGYIGCEVPPTLCGSLPSANGAGILYTWSRPEN